MAQQQRKHLPLSECDRTVCCYWSTITERESTYSNRIRKYCNRDWWVLFYSNNWPNPAQAIFLVLVSKSRNTLGHNASLLTVLFSLKDRYSFSILFYSRDVDHSFEIFTYIYGIPWNDDARAYALQRHKETPDAPRMHDPLNMKHDRRSRLPFCATYWNSMGNCLQSGWQLHPRWRTTSVTGERSSLSMDQLTMGHESL